LEESAGRSAVVEWELELELRLYWILSYFENEK
jgi:hypothetical protein